MLQLYIRSVDVVRGNCVGVGFPNCAIKSYDAYKLFCMHVGLFYIVDDVFEETISSKQEMKVSGNIIKPMDSFLQFKEIFYNPHDPDLPSLELNEKSSFLYPALIAWKSMVHRLEKINPAYKEFTQFIIELENYFTYMLGSFKNPKNNHHSEYMYRLTR